MANKKVILGIETSCDETAAAILQQERRRVKILSNIIASSASLQSKYGGIIPEQAAREQIKSIIPVIKEALNEAKIKPEQLDAIAVTYGPGLIGSLLVGVETAKTLALIWNKPLIPVNHLIGHFYANWIEVIPHNGEGSSQNVSQTFIDEVKTESRNGFEALSRQDPKNNSSPKFPCVGLLVSGGHTDLVLFTSHGKFEYLGGTRDDAAGECFDKSARLLGLPYPGGPEISKLGQKGDPTAYKLPRPMHNSNDLDFSFSGLKTAVANLVQKFPVTLSETKSIYPSSSTQDDRTLPNLCASIEQAIIDSLVTKTVLAVQRSSVEQIIVAGGVASNQKLISDLKLKTQSAGWRTKLKIKLFVPPPHLCTDNAAMIASAAFFVGKKINPLNLQANPNLSLAD